MRSIAFADFLIGVGILFVFEGLLFAAVPGWMRRAMETRWRCRTTFCAWSASDRRWRA